jgi:hypothetical protein
MVMTIPRDVLQPRYRAHAGLRQFRGTPDLNGRRVAQAVRTSLCQPKVWHRGSSGVVPTDGSALRNGEAGHNAREELAKSVVRLAAVPRVELHLVGARDGSLQLTADNICGVRR